MRWLMVHLSVAVARFFEILFWAILQAAGAIVGVLVAGGLVLAGVVLWWRRRR